MARSSQSEEDKPHPVRASRIHGLASRVSCTATGPRGEPKPDVRVIEADQPAIDLLEAQDPEVPEMPRSAFDTVLRQNRERACLAVERGGGFRRPGGRERSRSSQGAGPGPSCPSARAGTGSHGPSQAPGLCGSCPSRHRGRPVGVGARVFDQRCAARAEQLRTELGVPFGTWLARRATSAAPSPAPLCGQVCDLSVVRASLPELKWRRCGFPTRARPRRTSGLGSSVRSSATSSHQARSNRVSKFDQALHAFSTR